MLLSTLMTGKATSPAYAGFATNDDFVLAIDTTGIAATPSDYSVVQVGITGHEASIAADTADARYVRTGKTQSKTGAQRTFAVAGERYVGDTFQDWALSLASLFGIGSDVIRKYVYFNILTGAGESGELNIVVSDTQTGDLGSRAAFAADMASTATPIAYTYGAYAPAISAQPAGISVASGATATFSVTAAVTDGGTLTYKWQKSADGITFADIALATSASYTTPATTSGDDGDVFRCLITNTKGTYSAVTISDHATLTVV